MSNVSPPSPEHLAGARIFGILAGSLLLSFVLTFWVEPHQWLAVRQAIPVSMSLQEAEKGFETLSNRAKSQIEVVNRRASSLSADSPSEDLLSKLRAQAAELNTLDAQHNVLERQLEILQEAFEKEHTGWTAELEELKDTAARLDAQTRIVRYQELFRQKTEKAERDLLFVGKVLDDGADIKRLVAMADHEAEIRKALENMESFTSEVTSFAQGLEATTNSVLADWINRP